MATTPAPWFSCAPRTATGSKCDLTVRILAGFRAGKTQISSSSSVVPELPRATLTYKAVRSKSGLLRRKCSLGSRLRNNEELFWARRRTFPGVRPSRAEADVSTDSRGQVAEDEGNSQSEPIGDDDASSTSGAARAHDFLKVTGVDYRPDGVDSNLLTDVNLSLPRNSLGLVYGRSGSGKTTLLQIMAGLAAPTSGAIFIDRSVASGSPGNGSAALQPLTRAEVAEKVGIVFQFPERYFLADTVVGELTFGWPKRQEHGPAIFALAVRLQAAIQAVGLDDVAGEMNPRALSGGNQRRLALAVQLVRMPELLLLDEPLAGLDWRARADVVKLLADLKKQCTIIVVSHDLRELKPLVDRAWRMEMGGRLLEEPWLSSLGDIDFPLRPPSAKP